MLGGAVAPQASVPEPELGALPSLVSAPWCPFTLPARQLWEQAARDAGRELRRLDIETDEGARLAVAVGVAGVPCLVAAPDRLVYGIQLGAKEAADVLGG